jgi:8-oxo-dGTP diphosphatase
MAIRKTLIIPLLLIVTLSTHFTYNKHYRPSVCVDAIIHTKDSILLIKRRFPPFKDNFALIGGFLDRVETPEEALLREVKEETGLQIDSFEPKLVAVDGSIGGDVRGHAVTIVYSVLVQSKLRPQAGDDAATAQWFNWDDVPDKLAFSHSHFISIFRGNQSRKSG